MNALQELIAHHEMLAKQLRQCAEWTPIKEIQDLQLLDAQKHERWVVALREADGEECCANHPKCAHQQQKISELNQTK